jgi:hypothetical protein
MDNSDIAAHYVCVSVSKASAKAIRILKGGHRRKQLAIVLRPKKGDLTPTVASADLTESSGIS